MTGFLLDTNALLLFAIEPERVSKTHREAFAGLDRYVSQVCAIEIAIKFSLGKLTLPPPFQIDFPRAFTEMARELSADILPISLNHIDRLSRLPLLHRDPFDRLIIAQSLEDDLTVMTRDRAFAAYPGLSLVQI
ncbi:MAG TPA: type II toxin-antitoxin system VapC family toxin [Caulobacteraceae bacterium]|nr:type II toxin-antitoxin system VapC family toxin [Caulobacteraceae bacterium]